MVIFKTVAFCTSCRTLEFSVSPPNIFFLIRRNQIIFLRYSLNFVIDLALDTFCNVVYLIHLFRSGISLFFIKDS